MSASADLPQVQDAVAGIADLAEAAAYDDYDLLLVRADFTYDGAMEMEGDLIRAQEVLPLDVDSGAFDHFKHLREAFRAAGHPLWIKAEVRVDQTGGAQVRFVYPD